MQPDGVGAGDISSSLISFPNSVWERRPRNSVSRCSPKQEFRPRPFPNRSLGTRGAKTVPKLEFGNEGREAQFFGPVILSERCNVAHGRAGVKMPAGGCSN